MIPFNLFNDAGYINVSAIRQYMKKNRIPFCWMWAGRGTGKTYGVLKYQIEHNEKFMFVRRTDKQIKLIMNPQYMPFKALNLKEGYNIQPRSIGAGMYGFFPCDVEDGKLIYKEPMIAPAAAVSTVGNIRGFDGTDLEAIFYDEFIPIKGERPLKNEAGNLFDLYETVNRNRELEGRDPLWFIGASNSNNPDNPYFTELGVLNRALKMGMSQDNEVYINKRAGFMLLCVNRSPSSAEKKDTALYRLTSGSDYEKMALDNEFVNIDTANVQPQNLQHYNAIVAIGGICIYRSKSGRRWYVSEHIKGDPERFTTTEINLLRFQRKYDFLRTAYYSDQITFENHLTERLFAVYTKAV